MRSSIGLLLLGLAALLPQAGAGGGPADARAPRPVRVVYESGVLEATCTLVHTEPSGDGLALYFVTSARLFKSADGEPFRPASAVQITLADSTEIAIRREGVFLPPGNLVDIAVLRAEVPIAAVAAGSLTFDPPEPASAFVIVGYDGKGALSTINAHVRFASARLIVGDRDASSIAGCMGAPALNDDGIFGVVSECDTNRGGHHAAVGRVRLHRQACGLVGRPTLRDHS